MRRNLDINVVYDNYSEYNCYVDIVDGVSQEEYSFVAFDLRDTNDIKCVIIYDIVDFKRLKRPGEPNNEENSWKCVTYKIDRVIYEKWKDDILNFAFYAKNNVCVLESIPESVEYKDFNKPAVNPGAPLVIAICGASGCGKTTLSVELQKRLGIHSIVSYTTRPMRDGETDGVEHYFVTEDKMPSKDRMLAYTYFGDNHYWASIDDIEKYGTVTYTIDEQGILDLYDLEKEGKIRVMWIQIDRPENDVDDARKERDACRKAAMAEIGNKGYSPNFWILNDYKSVDEFLDQECHDVAYAVGSF